MFKLILIQKPLRFFFSDLKLRTFLKLSNKMSIFVTEVKMEQEFKKSYTSNINQPALWITFEGSLLKDDFIFLNLCVHLNVIIKSTGHTRMPTVENLQANDRLNDHLNTEFNRLTYKIIKGEPFEEYLINCSSKIYFFLEHTFRLP